MAAELNAEQQAGGGNQRTNPGSAPTAGGGMGKVGIEFPPKIFKMDASWQNHILLWRGVSRYTVVA